MPLEAPILDDRTFKDIYAEARALIPRYAPEWTNHNDSDPGIAMLQLFAWMTDMLIYRLNRVPERNYIKFLQLLGIELQPARPATAELTFNLDSDSIEYVIIPKGTQVSASEPDESGQPIVFETDEALIALGAKLAALQVYDGVGYSVETNANNTTGQVFYPFGAYARPGSSLMLGFSSPLAFTNQQVNLAVVVHETASQESAACSLQLDSLPPPATLVWEYWDGSEWKAASLDKDGTQAFSLSGHIYLRGPGTKMVKAALGDVSDALYWLRCRLAHSFYEESPQLEEIRLNTVAAAQAVTIRDEVLGGSNGRPNQSFSLSRGGLVALPQPETVVSAGGKKITVEYLRLEVSERPVVGVDQGFQVWEQVDDFAASGPDDAHFTLNRTTGEVRFGDGTHGRIPVANPDNPNGNIVARLYRSGGGSAGNVGAETLTNLLTFVEHIDSVSNYFAAYAGSNEETVEQAKSRAALELKSRGRAVTAEDFEYFALQTPGVRVRRAHALPLTHPQYPGVQVPGVVTVIVVPDADSSNPTPGQRTIQAVCECLNQHRLLTSEVYVIPPVYRKVKVSADIVVAPGADLASVKQAIESALTTYFHPLLGGEDGQGWEFGRTIFFSKVYQTILAVAGVDRIENNQLEIFLDDEAQPFCRDADLGEGELLYSDEHDIRVTYGF